MGIHGDIRHGQSFMHRIRWLAPTLVASVCVVAGSSWARTPGAYFAALQAGDAAVFDNVPVWLIRTYLNVALATYEKACPETAPSYARPWALAAYVATPAHANSGGSGLVLWTAANGLLNSWTSDAENDVLALKEQARCSASAHRAWVANAKAMAQDSRVAGPFPQARELCEESRAAPTVCACFSNSYDMEATPAERRRVRDAGRRRWPARNAEIPPPICLRAFPTSARHRPRSPAPLQSTCTPPTSTTASRKAPIESSIPSPVHKPARRARSAATSIGAIRLRASCSQRARARSPARVICWLCTTREVSPKMRLACSRTARCDCNPETHRSRWTCCRALPKEIRQLKTPVVRSGVTEVAAVSLLAPRRRPEAQLPRRSSAQRWPQTFRCSAPSLRPCLE